MLISARSFDQILITERNAQYEKLITRAKESVVSAKKVVQVLSNLETLAGYPPFEKKAEINEFIDIVNSLMAQKIEWRVLTRYVNRLDESVQSVLH